MTSSTLGHLRSLIAERGLDAVLISSPTNRRYLSGYRADDHAVDESAGMLLISEDHAVLFTSGVNADWARSEATGFSVITIKRPWEAAIAEHAQELGHLRIGFEDRGLVVSAHRAFMAASEVLVWEPLDGSVDALRAQKSPQEIGELERAIRLTDDVFAAVVSRISPGETESSIAERIERLTQEMTDGTIAFDPIVASGPNSARPHHAVSKRAVREGEPIVIDLGVTSNGYRGDLTRTIWLGEPSTRLREVYNVVHRAQAMALSLVGPGVPVKQVDQAARDAITTAGFENYIVHAVGHGLGLRVHEAPSVSIASEDVLREGHVVTIEPGVYIPDWGGVRIEDVAVVTADGSRNVTTAAKHPGWET